MPRTSLIIGSLALLVTGLLPAAVPSAAAAQPRDEERYVNLQAGESLRSVKPDKIATGNAGEHIEVYGSVGDNEGGMDWRTINAYSYLVDSVPKGQHSYTTLFNSLYDDRAIRRVADPANPGLQKWEVAQPSEVFAPTAAYLNQVNLYADAPAEASKFLHVLGAKRSMDAAFSNNSSLAKLVMSGYGGRAGQRAVDYNHCPGNGGCLSGRDNLMHSKYGAFAQAKDSRGVLRSNVVWITSSNLNGSSGSKKSNVSIAIFGDPVVGGRTVSDKNEDAYKAITDDIFTPSVKIAKGATFAQAVRDTNYGDAISLNSNGVMKGIPTRSGVTLLPSPRRQSAAASNTATTDVEAAFLKQQADKTSRPGCKVYAVHSLFNASRGGVRDGLGRLASQRCDVRVVLGTNAISDVVDGYFNMSSSLRDLVGKVEFANVHDKTLSYFDNSTATTFGGATNFTGTSLEFDELAFRADNLDVTNAVQEHSERIYQLGRGQTKWATPSSVSISPAGTSKVRTGQTLQLSPRLKPENALVTETRWTSSAPLVAEVDANGLVRAGLVPGRTTITVEVLSPEVVGGGQRVSRKANVTVDVVASGVTTPSAGPRASVAPTLTMDNYQAPGGTTDIVVTWGADGKEYDGVVKLQYYSGGWKTYGSNITVKDGVGRLKKNFASSKTWRAYGARLDRIDGRAVPNSTAKTKSKWSINTVRTKPSTLTPRLYATSLAAKSSRVPFLISWQRGNGKVRLQMRSSGGSWKTHSTYTIPSGASQTFISIPIANTKFWRIATSTGATKVSNTVKVSMK